MATEHVPGKPHVGTFVAYYSPQLMQRIGFTEGYGGRYEGPYAALVTNEIGAGCTLLVFLPGVAPVELSAVPHKDEAPAFVESDGTNRPAPSQKGYWDWQTGTQAARAAKELKAVEDLKDA